MTNSTAAPFSPTKKVLRRPETAGKAKRDPEARENATRPSSSRPDSKTPSITYRSPSDIEPYQGKVTMVAILGVVFGTMEDFVHLRHFSSGTGYVLEFSTRIGDAHLVGADFVESEDNGKITD